MVALAAQPILTTIGRVAVPKLADTLVRTGANKFVKQYGQKAFEAVLGTTAGLKAYKETEEYLTEYLNHIDSGGDEGSFVPKGSMPGTDRMTQMDAAMAVPNVNPNINKNDSNEEDTVDSNQLTTNQNKDYEPPLNEPPKEEPPEGPNFGKDLTTEAATQATKKLLEDKKLDVSKQTKDLVPEKAELGPLTTVSKTTPREYKGEIIEGTGLNQNLKDAIAKYAGTPEDIAESLKMPQSHKRKIYIQLEEYLNKNYPSKLSEKEQEVESDALFYIANSVYDIYTYRGEGDMPRDTLMVQDDIGFPLATAEIERYPKGKVNYYPRRKKGNRYVKTEPAIYIETIGSLNTDATSMVLDQIEKIADSEQVRYIVAEDLTSEAAAKALEKRGFVPAKKGFFEGDIINEADWRGGKKNVKQKNMVLDLGKKYKTTEKEIQEEFIKEQTDNLLKKK